MPTSDSEDFESADEGMHEASSVKKERKKRISSSNYSDTTQESDVEPKKTAAASAEKPEASSVKNIKENADGWDDFNVEDDEPIVVAKENKVPPKNVSETVKKSESPEKKESKAAKVNKKSEDTGWNDFDDWECGDTNTDKEPPSKSDVFTHTKMKSLADLLSEPPAKEKAGWGWTGWGVDSLLSTATAGFSTISTHVSQGISTVLETGIGAPDPEELARQTRSSEQRANAGDLRSPQSEEARPDEGAFQFGSLMSGVTKFVESTGTNAADFKKPQSEEARPDENAFQFGSLISGVTKFVETTELSFILNSPIKKRKPTALTVGEKDIILNFFKYIMNTWPEDKYRSNKEMLAKTSAITGVGESTIYRILKEYTDTHKFVPKNTTKKMLNVIKKLDDFDKVAIRQTVHSFYVQGELPTLDKILKKINEDDSLPKLGKSSLRRILKHLKFEFSKSSMNRTLIESPEIVIWRTRYLREMQNYRNENRNIYYLDETFINAGTKVIAGGLDTLETIGKKTMEVLQDGDPGLAKKRAMLGLDPGEKVVLSQVLREAKARADDEDRLKEEKREAKEVHYETLFDDFEGLVHLEALEMLSKQVSMRIEERVRSVDLDKRTEIQETLQQVSELCEMPDEDDDDDEEEPSPEGSRADAFHERLQQATQDLGLKLQFQPLVKQCTDTECWLKTVTDVTEKAVYKRAVSDLAHYTALSMELYHKTGEMLLVKPRRSTADEADALTQMTVVLTKQIGELAAKFTDKLNSIPSDNKEQINTYITNVFLEAGNSSTYIQNAFQLALPILQIGAV